MRGRACAALMLVALSACASTEPLTQLVVVVDTDLTIPEQLERVRIVVRDGQGTMREASAELASGAPRPVTLGLVSRTTLGPLDVEALGERMGSVVVRRRARVSFVAGRTLALRMDLLASCVAAACEDEQTCAEEGCRPIDVGPDELTAWEGPPSPIEPGVDAGSTADAGASPFDAGMGDDAGEAPTDAGPRDAGAVDAPPGGCSSASECDDGVACTTDTCVERSCVHTPDSTLCDDGVACTGDACDPVAGCTATPDSSQCDDGVACTADACVPLVGCRATPAHDECALGSYCDPLGGCTAAPTFTTIYTDILRARCGPCHTTAGSRGGDLDFGTQTQAYLELVGVAATCGTGNVRVIPRDATRSLLWRKLSGVDLCGDLMPRMSMQLDAASIAQIAQWINAGALE